ncbi:hypothetical protein BGW38_010159 [Lunasporangiospora selenospora]|uniref:Uncharacterized protein n=1 Tax=Lunasporangiospora selenospora TaxID=979761 RepID=A0A9P6FX51_9FUNG|nr:hypothetical protein BGW38_010159 [Lunasporangiospora selenospora]
MSSFSASQPLSQAVSSSPSTSTTLALNPTTASTHDKPAELYAESEKLPDCEHEELLRSLLAHEIKRAEVSDIMVIIGILAPSMPTDTMLRFFSRQQLDSILKPKTELPGVAIDDAAIMKAVRMYLNMKGEEAKMPCTGVEKKVRIMLETLLEYLPLKTDYTVSESKFTIKCVAPIIQAYVNNEKVVSDL